MEGIRATTIIKAIMFCLFFGAPIAVLWGASHGFYVFTSYREPKLIHIQAFSWMLIAVFWYIAARNEELLLRVKAILEDRFFLFLLLFLGYLGLTATNALVVQASFYELIQYVTLLNLYVILVTLWQDPSYLKVGLLGAVMGMGVALLVGLYQYFIGPIPFLIPLGNRWYAAYASTFGYKNPMALALTAQVYLVALLFFFLRPFGSGRWLSILAGLLLLGVELFYVAILGSRTSYVAISISILGLVVFVFIRAIYKRHFMALAIVLVLVFAGSAVFGIAYKTNKLTRVRVHMTLAYLKAPKSYWGSDRGIYLRNSIHMANTRLLGVGVGNWGIAYPFYRKIKPHFLFGKTIQVRRAHNDYAQMLGEAGWPGLALFLLFLFWPLYRGWRVAFDVGGAATLSMIQFFTFLFLMLTDFCIEMPYHKFFLFALICLVQAHYMGWLNLTTTGQIWPRNRWGGQITRSALL